MEQRRSASFQSIEGATLESREDVALTPHADVNGRHGMPLGDSPCACWTHELDDFLKQSAATYKDHERRSIEAIRSANPGISKAVIWERIVYLGLTERTRPPYDGHEWTEVEDGILLAEYGNGREGAHSATAKILALHPDWTHDAVAWRAHALGVTNRRNGSTRRWDQKLDEALRELADCTLETIARRLGRTPKAILARIRRLGFDATFFGGHKTKDLVRYLNVSELQIKSWVRLGWLRRRNRRITDDSLGQFCSEHSDLIPFECLAVEAQVWIRSLGHPGAKR